MDSVLDSCVYKASTGKYHNFFFIFILKEIGNSANLHSTFANLIKKNVTLEKPIAVS